MIKIGVCVPGRDWDAEFGVALIRALSYCNHDWNIFVAKSCLVDKNRRELVKCALEAKCTHIMFFDTDMLFSGDVINDLVAKDKDIIAANCTNRGFPITFTASMNGDVKEKVKTFENSTGLEEVKAVGTAVMLIKASVFDKIGKPWFLVGWNVRAGEYLGEDYWFCEQVRKAGLKIYIDHDVSKSIKHIGQYAYSWRDYKDGEQGMDKA